MAPDIPRPAPYKRLIVCVDGTWLGSDLGGISWLESILRHGSWLTSGLDVANRPSNVALMSRSIAKTGIDKDGLLVKQIVYYHASLGSGSLPFQNSIYGCLGWSLEQDIAQIYDFIATNYEKNDEIFLFGFSRGAFTARAVAGLLCDVGVLKSLRMSRFPELWRAYQRNTHGDKFRHSPWYLEHHKGLELTDVKVKVLGVWDTVGAIGRAFRQIGKVFNSSNGLEFPSTTIIPFIGQVYQNASIDYAYQALALDEQRMNFPPILWHKTATGPAKELKQCWFPGAHGNIGGQAEVWPASGDYGQIGYMSFAWMVDNLSGKLTFDRSAIKTVIDMHTVALYKIGRKHSLNGTNCWSCGDVVSNFRALPDPFLWLLGTKARTPANYPKAVKCGVDNATNETIHPSARIRRGRIASWSPSSLAGWTLEEHVQGEGWKWTKYGKEPLPEEVLDPNDQRMCWAYSCSDLGEIGDEETDDLEVKAYRVKDDKTKSRHRAYRERDGKTEIIAGSLKFNKDVGSLSRKLCPDNILRQLDTGNGLTIDRIEPIANGTNGINGPNGISPKSKRVKAGVNGVNGTKADVNGH